MKNEKFARVRNVVVGETNYIVGIEVWYKISNDRKIKRKADASDLVPKSETSKLDMIELTLSKPEEINSGNIGKPEGINSGES